MIWIATLIILLSGYAGFSIGWKFSQIMEWIASAVPNPEEEGKVVNPKSPEMADVTDSGSVISPKTPDQIEREAELELRKRNGL